MFFGCTESQRKCEHQLRVSTWRLCVCLAPSGYLLDPHDGVVELRVDGLQVFQGGFLVQHLLVERQRESGVYELPVV